ncbi:MAG TPA: flagellar biosynthetic protein FliO [Candidatus Eisenbacteria bacterium]|jgi:flagellar biogenesis protein FliO|nr:flagellar biosynthetic protein FliO [Candidatus Eisenbacteria bacterium]
MNQAVFVYATSLSVAALVLYGAVRYFWRRPSQGTETSYGPPPPEVLVLGRTRVGVGRSLLIVEVEGRRLLLGSTAHHWTPIADLGLARHHGADDDSNSIEAELARAVEASRQRRGGKRS